MNWRRLKLLDCQPVRRWLAWELRLEVAFWISFSKYLLCRCIGYSNEQNKYSSCHGVYILLGKQILYILQSEKC